MMARLATFVNTIDRSALVDNRGVLSQRMPHSLLSVSACEGPYEALSTLFTSHGSFLAPWEASRKSRLDGSLGWILRLS